MNLELKKLRVGNGYDVHRFVSGRDLILGGQKIDHDLGLDGHSDADVLVHSIMDSLLGASGLGDIGKHFPDNDLSYKDISSIKLLEKVYRFLTEKQIQIINIDSTVICEKPKILPYVSYMKANISSALGGLDPDSIGIKGTTSEGLGFTGRGEGIAVYSVSLLIIP